MTQIIDLKKQNEEEPEYEIQEESLPENYPVEPAASKDTVYHEWDAPEYIYHEKNKRWYMYVLGFTAAAITLAIIFDSGLSALIFGLIGAIIMFTANQKPKHLKFSISPLGILAGERHFEFSHLDSFWIHYMPGVQELSLKSKKIFSPYVKIPLGNQDPVFIRNMLISYLPEERQEEELTDMLMRKIKF